MKELVKPERGFMGSTTLEDGPRSAFATPSV
jgi:hypothetical protein